MNDNELTEEDYKLLMEGLNARMDILPNPEMSSRFVERMSGLVGPEVVEEGRKAVDNLRKERDLMEERVTLLKAKLIKIRQALAADRLGRD